MDASALIAAGSVLITVILGYFTVRAQVQEQRAREAQARAEARQAAVREGYEQAMNETRPQLERLTLELSLTQRELGHAERELELERQKGARP